MKNKSKKEKGGIKLFVLKNKEKLELDFNRIHETGRVLLQEGEDVVKVAGYERRKDYSTIQEVYHINDTTLRIRPGRDIPIAVFGTPSKIERNMPIYEKLIGDKLIQS